MRIHAVAWTESAARDLEAIIGFIAADSKENAQKVLAKLREKAADLARLPERGRVVPELARFGIAEYRELISRPYRIVYRMREDMVHVLAVIDGRRDVEELLFERLTHAPEISKSYVTTTARRRQKKP